LLRNAKAQYPFGYNEVPFDQLPPLCPQGQLYVIFFILLIVGWRNRWTALMPQLPRRDGQVSRPSTCWGPVSERQGWYVLRVKCQRATTCGPKIPANQIDECQFPPDYRDLAGYLNVNGSMCLNYTCEYVQKSIAPHLIIYRGRAANSRWANASIGQDCINDNTAYTAYSDSGSAYAFIVSRDK